MGAKKLTSAPTTGGKQVCAAGIAGIKAGGFGLLCLTHLDNPTFDTAGSIAPINTGDKVKTKYWCGGGNPDVRDGGAVYTAIDLGCKHQGNPILQMVFSLSLDFCH